MSKRIDLTGRVFGRWTVLDVAVSDFFGAAHWWCECECGVRRRVAGTSLRTGATLSCGCWRAELSSARHGVRKVSLPPSLCRPGWGMTSKEKR